MLSRILRHLGAFVSVVARSREDLAWIRANNLHGVKIENMGAELTRQDVIFNTIPSQILNKEALSKVRQQTLIVDLASKPGGADFEAAAQNGLDIIWALSLPLDDI